MQEKLASRVANGRPSRTRRANEVRPTPWLGRGLNAPHVSRVIQNVETGRRAFHAREQVSEQDLFERPNGRFQLSFRRSLELCTGRTLVFELGHDSVVSRKVVRAEHPVDPVGTLKAGSMILSLAVYAYAVDAPEHTAAKR